MEQLIVFGAGMGMVALIWLIESRQHRRNKIKRIKKMSNWHCSQSRSWVTRYPNMRQYGIIGVRIPDYYKLLTLKQIIMSNVTIIKTVKLPDTNNAWGFGGARLKYEHTMSNGDVWISGQACFRHLDPVNFIRCDKLNVDMGGRGHTAIMEYYAKQ